AADGTADGDHCHRAEAHPVRAEQDHLNHVRAGLHAAVAPDFDAISQPGAQQGGVRLHHADLGGQADVLERVLAGRAGAAVVAGDVDDVGVGFRYAHRNDANAGHDGQLDGHLDARVAGLEFLDELGQVFNRVDVVVVGRGNQVNADGGIACRCNFCRNLLAGQMAALAGLGALPDLDFQQVGRVDQFSIDAEPPRG